MNADSQLVKLARGLMEIAREEPGHRVRHQLERGALLKLYVLDGEWHLLIMRKDVTPSETEVRLFREAFGVPPDVPTQPLTVFAVRVVWPEPKAPEPSREDWPEF